MSLLRTRLPLLVADLTSALVRIGRGDLADQLETLHLDRWSYDGFAQAVYLHVRAPGGTPGRERAENPADIVCLADDMDANLELDEHRRLVGIEVLGASELAARLAAEPGDE